MSRHSIHGTKMREMCPLIPRDSSSLENGSILQNRGPKFGPTHHSFEYEKFGDGVPRVSHQGPDRRRRRDP